MRIPMTRSARKTSLRVRACLTLTLSAMLPALLLSPIAQANAAEDKQVGRQAGNLPDFGANTSEWANDGECDDPRFVGVGMAAALVTENIGRDARDCRRAHDKKRIKLNPLFAEPAEDAVIDFGDNLSDFAFDDACDDIRFTGEYASQMIYLVEDIGHDAADCQAAFAKGIARWQGAIVNPEPGLSVDDVSREQAGDRRIDDTI